MRIKECIKMDNQFFDDYCDIKNDISIVLKTCIVNNNQLESVEKIIDKILREHLGINFEDEELENECMFH